MELHLPNRLWHFHGGLHPEQHKKITCETMIRGIPLPDRLILPLQQHIGAEAELDVNVGDYVYKGQPIARANGYVSAALHAPTSGTVTEIGEHRLPHPSGLSGACIIIKPDGKDSWWPTMPAPVESYLDMDPADIRQRIRDAGIVGLGGAAFPTAVKLNPPSRQHIDTLIINGAECEPYITCDDRLMRERAEEVIEGACIIRHVLGITRVLIGVEDNKPEACASLRQVLKDKGIKDIEASWVLATNDEANRSTVNLGGKVYKTYRVYEREI